MKLTQIYLLSYSHTDKQDEFTFQNTTVFATCEREADIT